MQINEAMVGIGLTLTSAVVGLLTGVAGAGIRVGKALQRAEDRLTSADTWRIAHEVQAEITRADTISRLNDIAADVKEIGLKVARIEGRMEGK